MARNPKKNDDLFELFFKHYEEEMLKMPPVQIIVAGKTGVGKSTLINAVFREPVAQVGAGLPVTTSLQQYEAEDLPLILYDTRGFELDPHSQAQVKDEILGLIHDKANTNDNADQIHLLWYCVNALGNRVEEFEIEFLKELGKEVPVVLVLTQSLQQPSDFEAALQAMNLPVEAIIPLMAKDYPLGDQTVEAYGLNRLVDQSLELLPEDVQGSFINAQAVDYEKKVQRAKAAVKAYVTTAFATGFSPIPFSDAAVLVPMQIGMMAHLSSIFGISIKKSGLRQLLTALGGVSFSTWIGRTIAGGLFKFFPGAGTIGGGIISGGTAATVTLALGNAYIRLMEVMERQDKSPKELHKLFKDFWKEELKRSKDLVPKLLGKNKDKHDDEDTADENAKNLDDDLDEDDE